MPISLTADFYYPQFCRSGLSAVMSRKEVIQSILFVVEELGVKPTCIRKSRTIRLKTISCCFEFWLDGFRRDHTQKTK